jgi:two-component system, chemotaxis family, protein-glutamate methylesterase/glutaminase
MSKRKDKQISVLIVDDSSVVRRTIDRIFKNHQDIGAVMTAPSGKLALRKIARHDPDVVTLDIEMPGMDGLATLTEIMSVSPRPVIMLSAYTFLGAEKTLRALELGAVDFIQKPAGKLTKDIEQVGDDLIQKIRAVAGLRSGLRKKYYPRSSCVTTPLSRKPISNNEKVSLSDTVAVVVIGASTGGPESLRKILAELPADFPTGIVVAQHMPEGFTRSFAKRLDDLCAMEVKEATNRDLILPGRVLIAPGHSHITVSRGDYGAYVELSRRQKVGGHRPSVDVLFNSAANSFGGSVLGVVLTGMGRDGAEGISKLKQSGALTMAQNESSSVVFGMPKAAIETGAVDQICDISEFSTELQRAVANSRIELDTADNVRSEISTQIQS